MTQHIIVLTDTQEAAIRIMADGTGESPDELVTRECLYYLTALMQDHRNKVLAEMPPEERAEVTALLTVAQSDYLKAKKPEGEIP
jgi:hypothetical protein